MTTATDDRLLPLRCAPELFGEDAAPSRDTLLLWIGRGYVAPNGTRIRLQAIKLGRAWFLSRRIVEEFGRECREAALGEPDPPRLRVPNGRARQRRRLSIDAARAANRARGLDG